jgi:hypothetical protein
VSWHTEVAGNPETRKSVLRRFFSVASFLQDNALTNRTLVTCREDIEDDFAIRTSDLTDIGVEVMKAAYEQWLGRIDAGVAPEDTSVLAKALTKLKST